MDISLLKETGLTEGEIKVYLALLELGQSTTGPIVKKSGIAKSIVYPILEKLLQKGLASYIIKEKTKHFQGAEPDKLLKYVSDRERKLGEVKKKIEKIIPELILKQKTETLSKATIYLGYKGIRTAHENVYKKLKKGEEYYYLGIPAYQPEEQHLYWERDHIRRIKLGVRCKLLYNLDTDKRILKNRNSYKGCEARYMSTDIKTPSTFLIYKDTVVIILQSPKTIAVEIINKEISDSFKSYFDEFWKNSSKIAKK